MGNNLGRKRQVVDEKYTRPQGLYQHKDVDHKKLKKLILDSKLAPCYPGDDECSSSDLEECPICFLHYPSLNRSRCCMKGICTECFLQMKTPNSARPTQCPFCKTSNYAVEYRGVKTKEEKGLEQIEEQRVIEAKIRMRQQELQDEEARMIKLREAGSSSSVSEPSESVICITAAVEDEETVASHDSCAATEIRRLPLRPRHHREDDFDLDLEDIMVMEAIWLSIQENDKRQLPGCSNNNNTSSTGQYITEDDSNSGEHISVTDSSASHSGGFACAIAAFAERQQTGGEASSTTSTSTLSSSHRENLPDSPSLDVAGGTQILKGKKRKTSLLLREEDSEKFHVGEPSRDDDTGWIDDTNISVAATTGSIYGDADEDEDEDEDEDGVAPTPFSSRDDASNGSFQLPVVPESFEEQMMLAMAVSLAEAGARTNAAQGVSWN